VPTKIASFRMTGGLNADVLPALVPPESWTDLTNMTFRNGVATGVPGYAGYGGVMTVAKPEHLVAMNGGESFLLGLAPTLVFAAGDPQAAIVNKVIEQIQPGIAAHAAATPAAWAGVAPGQAGQWTGGVMNGVPYFNHPGYSPVDMRAGVPFAILPGWAAAFGAGNGTMALRDYREFYVALGLGAVGIVDHDVVNWSARAAPTTTPAVWLPAAGNAAGNAFMPGGGDMVDACPLGDTLVVYKRRAIWTLRYVGGNYIFDAQRALQGVGALSQNCIVAVGRQHVFLTEDDVLQWTGAGSPSSLLDGKGRKLIAGVINEANSRNAFVLHLPRQHEIWACFPGSGQTYAGSVIVFDLQSGHVGKRTLLTTTHGTFVRERTAVGPGIYGQTFLAYNSGASSVLAQVDSGNLAVSGAALGSIAVRRGLDFGAPGRVKTVRWVRPWVTTPGGGAVGINCSAIGSQRPDESPAFPSATQYLTGTSDKVDLFAQGRFLSFSFQATSAGAWTLAGFDVGYELGAEE
jgi:hypothetical protein